MSAKKKMLIVTTPYIPGYSIKEIIGVVYGVTARSRTLGGVITGVQALVVGGKLDLYVSEAESALKEAINKMVSEAEKRGANAIIGLNISMSDVFGATVFTVWGTAVKAEPVTVSVPTLSMEEIASFAEAIGLTAPSKEQ